MLHFLISFLQVSGYIGIFVTMGLESCLIPIPSEIILPFSGDLVALGHLNFWGVIASATFGSLLGSFVEYSIGRYGSFISLERYARFLFLSERRVDRAQHQFEYRGELTVMLGRIVPFLRTFISLPAGLTRMNIERFLRFSFIGTFAWVYMLTWAGSYLGRRWHEVDDFIRPITVCVFLLTLIMLLISYRRYRKNR